MDADERVSDQLAEEIKIACSNASPSVGGFRLNRHDYFWNTTQVHSTYPPIRKIGQKKASPNIREKLTK